MAASAIFQLFCWAIVSLSGLALAAGGFPDPFVLQAISTDDQVNGNEVAACFGYFEAGDTAYTCVSNYCGTLDDCSRYQNRTVLLEDGSLAADVVGGQFWYIDPTDGALRFTPGGKAESPEAGLKGLEVTVDENGEFSWDGKANSWLACPVYGNPVVLQIYAPNGKHQNLSRTPCVEIQLLAKAVKSREEGAYMYT